ncbi:MAG: IS200/IS605 family transposase [Deltaproteobacteria bacterium]|jgi:putative transposase|nr:IS200/IS605 family transposase [Deltaproteobacteria bacterium]
MNNTRAKTNSDGDQTSDTRAKTTSDGHRNNNTRAKTTSDGDRTNDTRAKTNGDGDRTSDTRAKTNGHKAKAYNYRKPTDENNVPIKPRTFAPLNFFHMRVHVAWMTNGAKPVLSKEICYSLNKLIKEFSQKRSLEILKGEINRDSLYMFLTLTPKTPLDAVVNKLKQWTSDGLTNAFPALKREYPDGQVWSQGYFCLTEGQLGNEMKTYFRDQSRLAETKEK